MHFGLWLVNHPTYLIGLCLSLPTLAMMAFYAWRDDTTNVTRCGIAGIICCIIMWIGL